MLLRLEKDTSEADFRFGPICISKLVRIEGVRAEILDGQVEREEEIGESVQSWQIGLI